MSTDKIIDQSPLGKPANYLGEYDPNLLFPIARAPFRKKLNIEGALPFYGHDLWNAYELSWLNPKGKPISAIGQFLFPCFSPNIIEAKSFKLYLNSFHQTRFEDVETVAEIVKKDLALCVGSDIMLEIAPLMTIHSCELGRPHGFCLDNLDIDINEYQVNPSLLKVETEETRETVYTDIFKSNCLGTGQPDWGTVIIQYSGKKINYESLLRYLISYRQHKEFGEHCVERIFTDIWNHCQPVNLTVTAHFTRRGGLDTNSCRSNLAEVPVDSIRYIRQ